MAVNLVKVESQADYSGVGKLVDLQFAVVDITDAITYATNGIELDLTDIHPDLVAADVLFVQLHPKGDISEAVDTYFADFRHTSGTPANVGKLKIWYAVDVATTPTASKVAEVSDGSTINTDLRLLIGFVTPGTNA